MTAHTLGPDAERAARHLARQLERIVPPSLLADPYAFAIGFMADLLAEHWRRLPPAPDPIEQRRTAHPTPPTEEFLAAKAALRKEDQ